MIITNYEINNKKIIATGARLHITLLFLSFNRHVSNIHGLRDQPNKGKGFVMVTTKPYSLPRWSRTIFVKEILKMLRDTLSTCLTSAHTHSFTHPFNKYPLSTYNMSDSVLGGRNTEKKKNKTISAFIGF